MKITVQYSDEPIEVIDVISAQYSHDYVIKIGFSDGKAQEMDFAPFLQKTHHPSFKRYLNMDVFKAFHIEDGNLMWGDYDMIFPVADLWEGNI